LLDGGFRGGDPQIGGAFSDGGAVGEDLDVSGQWWLLRV
jgi:hypothetical protein